MNFRIFSQELINSLISKASRSPRTRQHLNIHQNYEDPCQRFFNAIGTGSYIRPHRHALDPKVETLVAVNGMFALICFDSGGLIDSVTKFGTEKFCGEADVGVGAELQPGIWHTVVALTEGAVLLEVKAGPFVPTAAKEPAPWAPEEGTADAAEYLDALRAAIAGWCAQTRPDAMAA